MDYKFTPVEDDYNETPEVFQESKGPKVMAIIGFVLGIVGICLSAIGFFAAFTVDISGIDTSLPEEQLELALQSAMMGQIFLAAIGLDLGIPGLVFSIIGKKSIANRGKAKTGLILSIISIVISIIDIVVIIAALTAQLVALTA